jgi:hypothetical protein
MGGGSLPDVRLPEGLATIVPTMQPLEGVAGTRQRQSLPGAGSGRGQWCLGRPGGDYLIYVEDRSDTLNVNLPGPPARYRVHWIDARSGETTSGGEVTTGRPLRLRPQASAVWLERTAND